MILLLASVAAAEPVIDATRTLSLSSAEILGMGGAGIGFATGAGGTFFQPGAAANRKIESRSALAVSFALNRLRIGPGTPADLGNLGVEGRWQGAMTNFGVAGVWRNGGLGLAVGSLAYEGRDGAVVVSEGHLGGGGTVWDGRVTFGTGWRLLSFQAEAGGEDGVWTGLGIETGIALNGVVEGWNMGVVVRGPIRATRAAGSLDLAVEGVAVPWEVAVGVGRYDPRPHTPRPVRVAADLVIDGPVADGVSLESVLVGSPRTRGATLTVEPHLGVEATVLPERLRLRAGAYLEPARSVGAAPRPHATTGLELRLFHFDLFGLLEGDLAWEAAIDVAPRYTNLAWLGIGFWQRGVTGVGWEAPERRSDGRAAPGAEAPE